MSDSQLVEIISQSGFTKKEEELLRRARSLAEPILIEYLQSKGIKPLGEFGSYDSVQLGFALNEVSFEELPLLSKQIYSTVRIARRNRLVLQDRLLPPPDCHVFDFLHDLLKPASYFFSTDSSYSLVGQLSIEFDQKFSSAPKDTIEAISQKRELDRKEFSVRNLISAIKNRGILPNEDGEYTVASLSHIITSERFEYLDGVAMAFQHAPGHRKVIDFIIQLPANSYGENIISLDCDSFATIKKLREKYGL